jgi:hypothetical protein
VLLLTTLAFAHGNGDYTEDETEAIIYTGLNIEREIVKHEEEVLEHAKEDKTVKEVFDTLSEEQKNVVYAMIAHALSEAPEAKHSDEDEEDVHNSNEKGETTIMKHNVFEKGQETKEGPRITREHMKTILEDAKKCGSLKESFLAHMEELGIDPETLMHDARPVAGVDYGITNIDILFPDARTLRTHPDLVKRDDSWVAGVMANTHHTPFSRIKSMYADLTADEARAKGYITGELKKEEVFPVAKRVTTPTTVYKKQRLDRDDIVDITDFDVVVWLKGEMRLMLNEELARAVLIGDGREADDPDKINPVKHSSYLDRS